MVRPIAMTLTAYVGPTVALVSVAATEYCKAKNNAMGAPTAMQHARWALVRKDNCAAGRRLHASIR